MGAAPQGQEVDQEGDGCGPPRPGIHPRAGARGIGRASVLPSAALAGRLLVVHAKLAHEAEVSCGESSCVIKDASTREVCRPYAVPPSARPSVPPERLGSRPPRVLRAVGYTTDSASWAERRRSRRCWVEWASAEFGGDARRRPAAKLQALLHAVRRRCWRWRVPRHGSMSYLGQEGTCCSCTTERRSTSQCETHLEEGTPVTRRLSLRRLIAGASSGTSSPRLSV